MGARYSLRFWTGPETQPTSCKMKTRYSLHVQTSLESQTTSRTMGSAYSLPVQIGPAAHPAYCRMGIDPFSEVKRPWPGIVTHPILSPTLCFCRAILPPLWPHLKFCLKHFWSLHLLPSVVEYCSHSLPLAHSGGCLISSCPCILPWIFPRGNIFHPKGGSTFQCTRRNNRDDKALLCHRRHSHDVDHCGSWEVVIRLQSNENNVSCRWRIL